VQGHFSEVGALSFSPDGTYIASGGDDAKLKVWVASSGYCFVTFSEHRARVTDVAWTPSSNAVLSASLDGTVRAFDLVRCGR
jgi:periodic tryptophan protein 2